MPTEPPVGTFCFPLQERAQPFSYGYSPQNRGDFTVSPKTSHIEKALVVPAPQWGGLDFFGSFRARSCTGGSMKGASKIDEILCRK